MVNSVGSMKINGAAASRPNPRVVAAAEGAIAAHAAGQYIDELKGEKYI